MDPELTSADYSTLKQETVSPALTKGQVCFLMHRAIFSSGQVAQSVEQGTENPRVGGSIPPLATTLSAVFYNRCYSQKVKRR